MKKIYLAALVVGMLIMLVGCAQVGPALIGPPVYRSSQDTMVSRNNAKREIYLSEQQSQQEARERAAARNQVALSEISSGESTGVIPNGNLIGGFTAIFINDEVCDMQFTITKKDGVYKGKQWLINVPHDKDERLQLEVGKYHVRYNPRINSGNGYFSNCSSGESEFVVYSDPVFFYNQKEYYGGCRAFHKN